MRNFLLLVLVSLILFLGCKKDEEETKTVSLVSVSDGFITNSTPRTVHDSHNGLCGENIQIGWNGTGHAMRGFISFDITEILPGEGEKLTIENATLRVYECNTNLHPFDGDNGTRMVETFLIDYGQLHAGDYDMAVLDECGTLATWGYNVLEEHSLNVKEVLQEYYSSDPDNISMFQFRIQFTHDGNIANPNESELDASIWSFFAEEESSYSDFRPTLDIEYTISAED